MERVYKQIKSEIRGVIFWVNTIRKLHKLRETMRQTDIGHNISVELEKVQLQLIFRTSKEEGSKREISINTKKRLSKNILKKLGKVNLFKRKKKNLLNSLYSSKKKYSRILHKMRSYCVMIYYHFSLIYFIWVFAFVFKINFLY